MKVPGRSKWTFSDISKRIFDLLVDTELVKLAEHYASGTINGRGHFSIPPEVFCYVDHLGELAVGGPSSTARAVRFIRDFFPMRYHDWAELCMRCGAMEPFTHTSHFHIVRPCPAGNRGRRAMAVNKSQPASRTGHSSSRVSIDGRPNAVYLVMNTCQLAYDLLFAIDSFMTRLRSDPRRKSDCQNRLDALAPIREHTSIQGSNRRQIVAQEIATVWASRGGLIDATGNVTKPHPKEHET